MIYFILGMLLFCMAAFILFCILNCRTLYDKLADDAQQEAFLQHYNDV